jgi:hypothetical protein
MPKMTVVSSASSVSSISAVIFRVSSKGGEMQ